MSIFRTVLSRPRAATATASLMLAGALAATTALTSPAAAASYGGAPIESPYKDYDKALQLRYTALADMEASENDGDDEWAYWSKARDARDGYLVLPTPPRGHDLSPADLAYATQTYERLLKAYQSGYPARATSHLADAQANFDCWLNDTEEGTNPARAQVCKTRIEDSLAVIERADRSAEIAKINTAQPTTSSADPTPVAPMASERPSFRDNRVAAAGEMVPAAGADAPGQARHNLFFAFDSDKLSPEASSLLREIAEDIQAKPFADVIVIGHADSAGPADYNRDLAKRRADKVAAALNSHGVSLARVEEMGQGEAAPAVPTGDGVAEPRNRRVEILIDDR